MDNERLNKQHAVTIDGMSKVRSKMLEFYALQYPELKKHAMNDTAPQIRPDKVKGMPRQAMTTDPTATEACKRLSVKRQVQIIEDCLDRASSCDEKLRAVIKDMCCYSYSSIEAAERGAKNGLYYSDRQLRRYKQLFLVFLDLAVDSAFAY